MLWSRPKPSVTPEDQEWLEDAVPALMQTFGYERLLGLPTLTPNTKYFPHDFKKDESDAEFVLEHVCSTLMTDRKRIELIIYDDASALVSPGIHMSSADRKGRSHGAAGTYQEIAPEQYRIVVDSKQLLNLHQLIATLAHEVAHIKILGERRLEPDDPQHELLTDLTVIVHGYGIFQGNSTVSFAQWQDSTHQGWSISRTGYLPEQVISYALALVTALKGEQPEWERYLSSAMRKHFARDRTYLLKHPEIVEAVRQRAYFVPDKPDE